MTNFELYVALPVIIISLLVQSILLFIDAKKKRTYAWFWGLWGLIQFPMPTLFYLLFVVIPYRRRQRKLNKGD
ncbi:transcriptional regulator [Bacillus sp. B15-48]|uniref:transcriptional regulator n=1 Tax=Bacillus sp. B15-48 TaxID=1548601 RepID=UPI00193EFB95|nr:transcriptional regulator [Bacillus sp. B15-48]MBM4765185.1 transcriptional regulator [Bacillus sp. B15-48]